MKRILILFVILIWFGTIIQAQEEKSGIGPSKGTVTVSLLLGNNAASNYNYWVALPEANQSSYSLSSYYNYNGYYLGNNSLVNMVGAEAKWFFTNTLALRLNGSTMLNAQPAYEGSPAVVVNKVVAIPEYKDVPARANANVFINIGVDKYFDTRNEHLFWYVAPVVNFDYARVSGFEVAGVDPTVDPGTTRYAEQYGIGLSGILGAEYYTEGGIVFGFELRAANYTYSMNSILPAEGLKPLRSDNHNVSFFSQPTVKIGFRF